MVIEVLGLATVFGLLFGWISFYVYASVLSFTGEWINGKSQPKDFQTVIAWALVPLISSLILVCLCWCFSPTI